jgi:hypothetical protein
MGLMNGCSTPQSSTNTVMSFSEKVVGGKSEDAKTSQGKRA